MQNHDDKRGHDGRESGGPGWRGERDDTQEARADRGEGRSWEPPYGDERSYGRQGQRGGSQMAPREGADRGGRYPRGGGTYGRGDFSRSAQTSASREGYRYGDSGQAGQGGFDATRERGAGGQGGYSGYGSSGQGQRGPGGYPRGGYGGSGIGGDYGQDPYGGGEYIRQSGIGQYRTGDDDHDRGDPSSSRGYEGVYGEGAGRSGGQGRYNETQGPGAGDKYEAYAGGGDADDRSGQHRSDFDPHYLEWRNSQLASYDQDYNHWRESQARSHDEEYNRWRDERRQKFHEDFHGWRQSRSAPGMTQSPISPSTAGTSYTGQSPSGGGATSGFATHQVSGATNADLSQATNSGGGSGFTGDASNPGDETRLSGGDAGGDAGGGGGGSAAVMTAPLAQGVDPAIRNIADGGDGREELHKDADKAGDKD